MSKNTLKKDSKKPSIKPLGDRVLIEEIEEKNVKTASGIILPDSANKDSKRGKVLAVGDGRMDHGVLIKPQVKVGDVVYYSWGDNIKINGQEYTLVSGDNITAVLE